MNHRRCHCWNSLNSSSRSRLVSGRVPLASLRELKNDLNFDLSSASTFCAGFILVSILSYPVSRPPLAPKQLRPPG